MTSSVQPQIIIAMKGHPCTGKTTMAKSLAEEFDCPLIKHDDVRSAFAMLQQPPPRFLSPAAEHLNNLSFEVICQTALVQLSLGLSVVLDSSLSRPARLDRLQQLSTSTGARLVIVECVPRDIVEWKKRLEEGQGVVNDDDGATTSWYKPSTSDDLERLLKEFDRSSDYDVGDISKLTVDTTAHVHKRVSHAVSRLSICKQIHKVDFTEWLDKGLEGLEGEEDYKPSVTSEEVAEIEEEKRFTHMHHLRFSSEVLEKDQRNTCRKCLQPISGPNYNCVESACDLCLHKSCAESPQKEDLKPFDCLPFLDPTSLKYSFPETYRCRFHLDVAAGEFSYDDCADCLFETHLKCSLLPTVLRHDFHDSPLFLFILPAAYEIIFRCLACGDEGKDALYRCIHCSFFVHVNCALLPLTLKNRQRHIHPLTLTSWLEVEDVLEQKCNACEGKRDPTFWVYDCKECEYTSHLSCVAPVKLNFP